MTFVIAEAGSNHNGSLETAKELCLAAHNAGADAVKFQLIRPFQESWIDELIEYCGSKIEFMATPFNEYGINVLKGKVDHWKVASTEASDPDFVAKVLKAAGKKTVFISDGAANVSRRKNVIPMVCCIKYPAELTDYSFQYRGVWGLSDHTKLSSILPIVAVSKGAVAVEKHLTLDKTQEGPDHAFALEPSEFADMVKAIRLVEKINTAKKLTVKDYVGRKLQWP